MIHPITHPQFIPYENAPTIRYLGRIMQAQENFSKADNAMNEAIRFDEVYF